MKTKTEVKIRFRRWATALFAVVLLITTAHGATTVLDQSVVPNPATAFQGVASPGSFFDLDTAQTFTVGVAGLLSRVDVFIGVDVGSTALLNWDIRPISISQSPVDSDGSALASGSMTLNNGPFGFVTFDLSQHPVSVSVGERLAIVLSASSGQLGWGGSEIAGYSGGESWQRCECFNNGFVWLDTQPQTDLGFRTFVTVPEPSVVALLSLAGVALAGCTVTKALRKRQVGRG